jgi:predicted permease
MVDVNYIFLLSIAIITIGYIVKNLKIITEENSEVIAKLVFNITLPAVILKIASSIEIVPNLILLPVTNILFSLLVLFIAFFIFKDYPSEVKGLVLMSVIGFNVANFSFPIIEGIFGENGLKHIALVDMGNGITIFVVCYIIGSLYSPKVKAQEIHVDAKYILKRLVRSAPLMSYFIALSINFSGLELPLFAVDLLDILARANTALILLLLGINLSFKFEKAEWKVILKVLAIRYSFGLCVGLLLYFFLPVTQFDQLFRIIITVSLILPVGMAIIPFAFELEYDQKLVSILTNLSLIISFFLMWILILLLGI